MMRAALNGDRIPMMELLVAHGADVNAEWSGYFPIIFAPCETVDAVALRWLLEHGANPNCDRAGRKYPGTALDYVIGTYGRSAQLGECMDILFDAGGVTKYDVPPVLLVSETYDAATPFAGALRARATFPRSVLIEGVNGTTHAGSLSGVSCVDNRIADYLLTGRLDARRAGSTSDVKCGAVAPPSPQSSSSTQLASSSPRSSALS